MKKISKPFLSILKDLKSNRHLSQKRVNDFNRELREKVERYNILATEMQDHITRINELKHLREMYRVMDGHSIMDLWELESALGITKKKYLEWKYDFEKTKDGFTFKV